ncbi:MAG: glycosyltransferase involved in cell wall biosis [Variovorax sp.]|nr:glycosyltransferase involved in cell wall biosis [Variovorax sp.]
MSQVTIYLDDDTLEAAKTAATRAGLSLSRWFARSAEAEKARLGADRASFWAEIDRLREGGGDGDWDFLLDQDRHRGLGQDAFREPF